MDKEKPKKLRLTIQKGQFSGFIPRKIKFKISKEDLDELAKIFKGNGRGEKE